MITPESRPPNKNRQLLDPVESGPPGGDQHPEPAEGGPPGADRQLLEPVESGAVDHERYLLDAAESARIFRDRIVPDQLGGDRQEQPVVVFVAGQPGDGKASITALAKAVLAGRGRPVVIGAAAYEPYHPRFHEPITDDPPTAGRHVAADGRRWAGAAEEWVIEQRSDVIVETELADPDAFVTSARAFKAAAFQVEVALLAVNEVLSWFGVLERHLRALEHYGFGRLVEQSVHDTGCAGVLRAADLIDQGDWVDRIAVLRPDGQPLYGNERDAAGGWRQPARTAAAIAAERARPWTAAETRTFLESALQVGRIGLAAPVQWIRDESLDGARTVTTMARPWLHPDAVTLHLATAGTAAPGG